jgi:hypothetical protein
MNEDLIKGLLKDLVTYEYTEPVFNVKLTRQEALFVRALLRKASNDLCQADSVRLLVITEQLRRI